jgi:hypothetical protein
MDRKHALTLLNRLAARRSEQGQRLVDALRGRLKDLADLVLDVAVETGDPIGTISSALIWGGDQVSLALFGASARACCRSHPQTHREPSLAMEVS